MKTHTREHGRNVFTSETDIDKVTACRWIVENKTFAIIDGATVDLFSASAIVKVFDALNDANKVKFATLHVAKMATVAFNCLK